MIRKAFICVSKLSAVLASRELREDGLICFLPKPKCVNGSAVRLQCAPGPQVQIPCEGAQWVSRPIRSNTTTRGT